MSDNPPDSSPAWQLLAFALAVFGLSIAAAYLPTPAWKLAETACHPQQGTAP